MAAGSRNEPPKARFAQLRSGPKPAGAPLETKIMTTADVFRSKADECDDAEAKRILREAAQEWRVLADHEEFRGGANF
jgi:hypothetical protein